MAGSCRLCLTDKPISAQCGEYINALQAAFCTGHGRIVWKQLEKGADVNTQGGVYGNVPASCFLWRTWQDCAALLNHQLQVGERFPKRLRVSCVMILFFSYSMSKPIGSLRWQPRNPTTAPRNLLYNRLTPWGQPIPHMSNISSIISIPYL